MKNLSDRLKGCRKELGLTQEALRKRANLKNQSIIASLETGHRQSTTYLPKIANALGVNALWLASGKGLKVPDGIYDISNKNQNDDSIIAIQLLSNSVAMGDGAIMLETDMVISSLSVQRSWVSKQLINVTNPDNLRFIHSHGDSMAPTFSDGDILLVDTGATTPTIDGIYVLEADDKIFIKRVSRRFDGGHQVSSDNPSVKMVDSLNGDNLVNIKGRVVWAWNGKRL